MTKNMIHPTTTPISANNTAYDFGLAATWRVRIQSRGVPKINAAGIEKSNAIVPTSAPHICTAMMPCKLNIPSAVARMPQQKMIVDKKHPANADKNATFKDCAMLRSGSMMRVTQTLFKYP